MTPEQSVALHDVVKQKLRLWDIATAAETLLGCEIDTNSRLFNDLCAAFDEVDDVDGISERDLITAFELEGRICLPAAPNQTS